jgi:hypothetical protein
MNSADRARKELDSALGDSAPSLYDVMQSDLAVRIVYDCAARVIANVSSQARVARRKGVDPLKQDLLTRLRFLAIKRDHV